MRFAVVASRFNDQVVSLLIDGALGCLQRHGASKEQIVLYRVPGAFELPLAVSRLESFGYHAVIALGALVRGETPHFDYISSQVTLELSRVSVDLGVPVAFGVLTCDTMEQALARTRKGRNKGWEAALAAMEMAGLYRQISYSMEK